MLPYSGYKKTRRLFETFRLIKTRQAATTAELCQLFEVDPKIVYHDVKELNNDWGSEIVFDKSSGKYVIHKDGMFSFIKSTFTLTSDDVVLILSTLVQSQSFMETKMNIIKDNLLKLLSDEEASKLKSILYFEKTSNPKESTIESNITKLRKAVAEEKKVTYTYKSADEKRSIKKLTPYSFACEFGKYYIIGKMEDSDHLSHYRIDRMSDVKILDESGKRDKNFIVHDYMKKTWYMYTGKETKILVKFKNDCYPVVTERNMAEGRLIEKNKDYFTYEFTANGTMGIKLWLLGFGDGAEVLGPVELRDEFREIVSGMARIYNV